MRHVTSMCSGMCSGESAQGALEYLLAVGGVVVVLILGLMAFDQVVQIVVGHLCPSVDTADALAAVGSCITS